MSEEAAILARRFAHALEGLRGSWDLQYVGAGPVPGPRPGSARAEAEHVEAEHVESEHAEAERVEAERVEAEHVEAEHVEAEHVEAEHVEAEHAESLDRRPAGSPATTGSLPLADPTQRAQAAQARKEALREQAQRWSPATKLEYLRRHNVGDCQRCPLARTRNRIVFGVGNPEADIMFVGEAPGADEDRLGEPFVGRAGQLLNQWLEQLGMQRADVYIANVLKCRPPGNRDPRPEEVDRCSPFLQAQIRAIEPRVIVALGRHAGMLLSRREDMTLRAMRSTSRLRYDAGAPKGDPSARIQIPLVVTYHPAYVLRQEGGGRRPPPGRPSPTEMVMTDLRRALGIAHAGDDTTDPARE